MAFVPEGQGDRSQARSAWGAMQRVPVPEGRLKSGVSWSEGRMKLKVNRRSADVRLTPNYGGQPSPEKRKTFWTSFNLAGVPALAPASAGRRLASNRKRDPFNRPAGTG
jgi:hypothetical protein